MRYADEILFMSGGRIVERGTHEQLMDLKGLYYELYKAQNVPVSEEVAI